MTILERVRASKNETRHCTFCGAAFVVVPLAKRHATYCCRRHQMRAWRARKMLEGTHGYAGKEGGWNFRRLPT